MSAGCLCACHPSTSVELSEAFDAFSIFFFPFRKFIFVPTPHGASQMTWDFYLWSLCFVVDINELAAQYHKTNSVAVWNVNELLAWPVAICSSVWIWCVRVCVWKTSSRAGIAFFFFFLFAASDVSFAWNNQNRCKQGSWRCWGRHLVCLRLTRSQCSELLRHHPAELVQHQSLAAAGKCLFISPNPFPSPPSKWLASTVFRVPARCGWGPQVLWNTPGRIPSGGSHTGQSLWKFPTPQSLLLRRLR